MESGKAFDKKSKKGRKNPQKADFSSHLVEKSVGIVENLPFFRVWKTFFDRMKHRSQAIDNIRQNIQKTGFKGFKKAV